MTIDLFSINVLLQCFFKYYGKTLQRDFCVNMFGSEKLNYIHLFSLYNVKKKNPATSFTLTAKTGSNKSILFLKFEPFE